MRGSKGICLIIIILISVSVCVNAFADEEIGRNGTMIQEVGYQDEWSFYIWLDGSAASKTQGLLDLNWPFLWSYLKKCYSSDPTGVNLIWCSTSFPQNLTHGTPLAWDVSKPPQFAANGLTGSQQQKSDYHTVIINMIPSSGPSDMPCAAYHPYGGEWTGPPDQPGLITIIKIGIDSYPVPQQDQVLGNCLAHEFYHCGAQTTNSSHCAASVPTCVINSTAVLPSFAQDLSHANTPTLIDDTGAPYYPPCFLHDKAEIKRLQWGMNVEQVK